MYSFNIVISSHGFCLGGYAYSVKVNPWPWLTSKEAAEEMAERVAEWPEKYGCDGIDLDIEDGAGDAEGAGKNMIHFVRKLKELQPKMIIGQPTYGYPAVN
jgi:chitinase